MLEDALRAQREAKEERRSTRRRRAEAHPHERIDYSSPGHTGEPHRGRATEAEKEYVRTHLSEVNPRLTRDGLRTIDPRDPKMAERYGLADQQPA